ncbi:sialate O-acetylesterase [Alteromonas stellipolaris]|uniref:sialate O-acetylesterase n=1 Tax=Alteromonas stellipolaris TaxID=233316 RepID=UPI0026E25204|nr:sialate O-acetylesterase [Alteromonas stellipolaris]MDO6534010.1 sialate O-acetylesterase [Alteromonas stellipolaris]MDO6626096.1 sialate O-acetylesterase [Alteromonas stellipolaris]
MKNTALVCLASLFSCSTIADEYLTFFMAGQSNMDGYGYVSELPSKLAKEQEALIFHGNGVFDNQENGGVGKWDKLKPGHGIGFKSDGSINTLSQRFGAELTFAQSIQQQYPGKNIAIIKYAVGGTGLALNTGYSNWYPNFTEGKGHNQYDFALETINNAYAANDIDGDGKPDTLKPMGIIWMQGEADAHASKESANAYLSNLTSMMNLFRAALRVDDLPVVIGKITDSELGEEDIMPYIERVHLAQQLFAESDNCATYMSNSDTYTYGDDPWHYTSKSFVQMGKDFALSYKKLIETCGLVKD